MTISANLIPLFLVMPFAGAFLIAIAGKYVKGFSACVGVLVAAALLVCSLLSVNAVRAAGILVYSVGAWKPPVGIAMVMDGLTVFMLVIVNFAALWIAVFSVKYMDHFTSKWKFYTLFLLMLGGMNGVIVTGDIFNLYVFLEIASLASFALVAFGTEKHELEAAFKYAVMSTVGSLFVLFSIVMLYSFTSTLNMADMAQILLRKGASPVVLMVSGLFIMGFGLKAALVPFHAWLPDAHPSAPAPISAMLSGVLIKSLGVYTLCRLFFNVVGMTPVISSVLMFMAVVSMLVGGFLSMAQWDYKRLLAYSSISQMGYIFLGIGLGTPLGILGALFHLFNHSIMKPLLFLNAGSLEYATGTRDLKQIEGGLMAKMPVTGATGLAGAMSLAGIPPFGGFWSKLIIIIAAVQSSQYGYALCAVLASLLTLAALLKAMQCSFLGAAREKWHRIKEVPVMMQIPLIVLALTCLFGGMLMLPGIRAVFLEPAIRTLMEGTQYATMVMRHLQ